MNLRVSNLAESHISVAAPAEVQPRPPLWPVFVISFAALVSFLWTAALLWLLLRMLLS
jgi:hypothetical protein